MASMAGLKATFEAYPAAGEELVEMRKALTKREGCQDYTG